MLNNTFRVYSKNKKYDILMLCTRLADITGRVIYEGDVVQCDDKRSTQFPTIVGEVIYNPKYARFEVRTEGSCYSFEHLEDILILGCVYEQPELLRINLYNSREDT